MDVQKKIQAGTMTESLIKDAEQTLGRKQQELAMLREQRSNQLMEEENPPPAGADAGDDLAQVLEQIAQMEAQERLQREGHAYRKPLTVNHVLADEDAEEQRIRQEVLKKAEMLEWRAERERQDAEFIESQRQDLLKAQQQQLQPLFPVSAYPASANEPAPSSTLFAMSDDLADDDESIPASEDNSEMTEPEPEPIPMTKEELRLARMAFFSNKKPTTQ